MGHHSHSHHLQAVESLNAVYFIAIALNFGFVIAEAAVGLCYNSIGLLSDAGHKLIDVFSLLIALLAFRLADSRPSERYTYGLRKTSVLISMLNAVILLIAVGVIVYESIDKISSPVEVNGAAISWTAGLGIIISAVSALLLMHHQKRDINTRGAFLHMATDALISVGVVISGLIISFTGWNIIDPLISLAVAALILYNTLKLLAASCRMCIDAVPENIDYKEVERAIKETPGVAGVSELHIWAVSVTQTALTAQLLLDGTVPSEEVTGAVRKSLETWNLSPVTLETRTR